MELYYAMAILVLVALVALLGWLKLKGNSMRLDELQAAVTAEDNVIDSVIVLLGQLSALVASSANDPAAIQKIADDINVKKDALASAVAANTPAAPAV